MPRPVGPQSRPARRIPRAASVLCALVVLLSGCAALERELDARKPTVEVEGLRLTGLDFGEARLQLDVRIDNPNPFEVSIAGLDYAVMVTGERLVSGEHRRPLEIPADGAETVGVPIRVRFDDVAAVLGGLGGRESVDYGVEAGVTVDMPVRGETRLPLRASGVLPVPQRPGLALAGVEIERLDASGARLVARIAVDNPNAFALALDGLDYALAVGGRDWASGRTEPDLVVPAGGEETVDLSLELDLAAIGAGAYRLLRGGGDADYRLRGEIAGALGERDLGRFTLGFDSSGRVTLER
ncbi:MAG: LEA type 2 family protein [Halofilum sp. (in: g-proteobacteria)]|nr:LEA type 2 family protein [Halofilum sp. (in: g-proteobacteria)]